MPDARIILTTFSSTEKARQIGTALLERQLVACLNLFPAGESLYLWKGKIEKESETIAFIKTTKPLVSKVKEVLIQLHPYHVPEILVLEVEEGSESYLDWLRRSVKS
ncbi:MAG: divalent-cation tolerance protein CutA [Akkermansiaceae bacterium]|jgi:periplasmic divalent cation tolerance protein|nr:divalent-cation tolerance protein CutA [Akkermansiaceae bacterium]